MTILYLAPIPFDGLKQRPQFIAEWLAKHHTVYYIEPTVSFMKYILKGNATFWGHSAVLSSGLTIRKLNGLFSLHRSLEAIPPLRLNVLSEQIQLQTMLAQCDVIWVGYCGWYGVISRYTAKMLVYDKMDDNVGITQNKLLKKLLLWQEPRLIQRADCIFVTARIFFENTVQVNPKTVLVPNGIQEFEELLPITAIRPQGRVFGYVGMISHWFDFDAIQTILDASPDYHVVLVGPTEVPVPKHPRLHMVGQVPKSAVSSWIDSFDTCLFPFKLNELLATINPVKLYEYLSRNKPVLAAKSSEMDTFSGLGYFYSSLGELRALLGRRLEPPFSSEAARYDFASRCTWESRVAVIEHTMSELFETYAG